jgi:hypothetical protein
MVKGFSVTFLHIRNLTEVKQMAVKLSVDGETLDLNSFVEKILNGTIVGAVTALRDVNKDWKKIELIITR